MAFTNTALEEALYYVVVVVVQLSLIFRLKITVIRISKNTKYSIFFQQSQLPNL